MTVIIITVSLLLITIVILRTLCFDKLKNAKKKGSGIFFSAPQRGKWNFIKFRYQQEENADYTNFE